MASDLSGKTVLVTGGSKGIGKATALALAKGKCNVAIGARDQQGLELAANQIEHLGVKCLPLVMDMANQKSIIDAIDKTVKEFGRLDILVNNAGALFVHDTSKITYDQFDSMLGINARGTFIACKHAMPYLSRVGGQIVNVSPPMVDTELWLQKHLPYSMSKYATSMLTIGLAAEQVAARSKVTVNSVWPKAVIWTEGVVSVGGDIERVRRHCRTPAIMGDSIFRLVSNELPRTGQLLFDEDILLEGSVEGRRSLDKYAEQSGEQLIYCTFLSQRDKMAFNGLELGSLLSDFN